LFQERAAITRMQGVMAVLVIVVAAGAGGYFLSQSGSGLVALTIVETDPVHQIDSFSPANLTVTHDTTITFAVQNGDDETRVFQISAFNVNQTIVSGQTVRFSFSVGQAGTYKMFSPQTAPSAASNGKPGSAITGYLIVK
jgi:hypothetical protein